MRLKISNRNSSLGGISSKLLETKTITQAGALFLLALAHESAKAKAYEPLSAVQQLLGERKAVPIGPDEAVQELQAGFDNLLSAWTGAVPEDANLDEAFEAMARMSASDSQVVLAQSGTNRAPVSDAAVDYIDPARFAPMKEASSLQGVSTPVQVPVQADLAAEESALSLKLEPELMLDPNAFAATGAGPLLLPVPLLSAAAVAVAASTGAGGTGSGSGGSTPPTNNTATISSEPGKDGGSVTTVAQKAMGKFSVQDVDAGQAGMQAQNNVAGKYGTFNLSADGTWGYELNPNLAAFKALPKDVMGKDSFTVKSLDGSAEKTVIVDVKGINDAPVITSTAQSGAVQEDGTLSATGQVLATDVDTNTVMTYTGSKPGDYGSFKVTTDGKWIYELNNAVVQNFAADKKVNETFTVTATDDQGIAVTQDVVITIKGSNDLPTVTGANAVAVSETNSPVQLDGQFSVTDIDAGESGFQTQTLSGLYGSLSVVSAGKWTYTAKEAFDYLSVNDKLVDSLSLKTIDGTTQALAVTIQGTNDNPTVTAALTSKTNEGDAAYPLDLLQGAKDVDAGDLAVLSVVSGSLTYTDNGVSSVNAPLGFNLKGNNLSIDPTDPSFDVLAAGVTKTIDLTYNIRDVFGGVVAQKATVIITGTNDAPRVVDITPALADRTITENPNVKNDTSFHTLNGTFKVTDPDASSQQIYKITAASSNSTNLGSFEFSQPDPLSGMANWMYKVQDMALDKMAAGDKSTVSNKFIVSDGISTTEASIDVILLGADTTSL